MMDTNFEYYKLFYMIVKEGSITKAAEKLFISQSAVTQALKKFEEVLGEKVFLRQKGGVILTTEGAKLFSYIESSVSTLLNARNMFNQYINPNYGFIKIGGGSAYGQLIAPKIISKLNQKYPNIEISMKNISTKEGIQKLLNNELDILIAEFTTMRNDLTYIPCAKSEYVFFTTNEYLNGNEITTKNLSEFNLILPSKGSDRRSFIDSKLEKMGISIEAKYEFSSANMIISMVENGLGIGCVNGLLIKDKLQKKELIKLDLNLDMSGNDLYIVVRNLEFTSAATRKLIEIIKEQF